MRISIRIGVAGLLLLLLAAAEPAAAGPGDPFDMRNACREDFQRYCSQLGGDAARDAIYACLKQHEDSVSDGCRVALGEEEDGSDWEPVPYPPLAPPSRPPARRP